MAAASSLLLADLVLALHTAIVLFVVGGLVAIWVGRWRRWPLVDRPAWRLAHLGAIGYVAAQQWLGATCPLTTLEAQLRTEGGQPGYATSFVGHWLQQLLYWSAPDWAFTLAYTLFALAVLGTWWLLPPRRAA